MHGEMSYLANPGTGKPVQYDITAMIAAGVTVATYPAVSPSLMVKESGSRGQDAEILSGPRLHSENHIIIPE